MTVENDPLLLQRRIRYQFESFCKTVIRNERYDYMNWLLHHMEHETNFSALPEALLDSICAIDGCPEGYNFQVCGYRVSIRNERLIEALLSLCAEQRSILILYYSLGLKDNEIADLLSTSRSRVQRIRSKAFHKLQKEMR